MMIPAVEKIEPVAAAVGLRGLPFSKNDSRIMTVAAGSGHGFIDEDALAMASSVGMGFLDPASVQGDHVESL